MTNENKIEYITLLCKHKMIHSIEDQIKAFLEGFFSIIPLKMVQIFNHWEIELLIAGYPDLDGKNENRQKEPNSLLSEGLESEHKLCWVYSH